jgi:transcriptional regulator with XRE-family HTH domain
MDERNENEQLLSEFAASEENRGLLGFSEQEGRKRLVHDRFRRYCEHHELSQTQLAGKAHTSAKVILDIENLRQFPSQTIRNQLATALETDRETLFPRWLDEFIPSTQEKEEDEPVDYEDVLPREELLQRQRSLTEYGVSLVDPHEQAERRDVHDIVFGKNSPLKEREKYVIRERFGIGERYYSTSEEIGTELNISRERVRQIEVWGLYKIKRFRRKQIKDYLAFVKEPETEETTVYKKTEEGGMEQAKPQKVDQLATPQVEAQRSQLEDQSVQEQEKETRYHGIKRRWNKLKGRLKGIWDKL